jgi:hypothetical protein
MEGGEVGIRSQLGSFSDLDVLASTSTAPVIRRQAGVDYARILHKIGAPESLVKDVALTSVYMPPDAETARLFRQAEEYLEGRLDAGGGVIHSDQVRLPMRVLAVAAPNESGSSVSATISLSRGGEGGLTLTFSAIGFKGSVKYKVNQSMTLSCDAGEAGFLYLLIPATREIHAFQPTRGGEVFPVERLIPHRDIHRIGQRSSRVDVREVLACSFDSEVPLQGDLSKEGKLERSLEASASLSLGVEFGEENNASISVGVSGSVSMNVEYDIAGGSHNLRWLTWPAGVCVTAVSDLDRP